MDLSKYPLFIPPDGPFIFGEYDLVEEIGSGGMGTVFKAWRCVSVGGSRYKARGVPARAVKVPSVQLLKTQPDLAQQILSEAEMALQVDHPAVVALTDAGEVSGIPYLAMELLEGEELADRLKRGPLPPEQVLTLGTALAEGLQAIHDAGLVHLDFKPQNVYLPQSGGVKILDLGLAAARQAGGGTTTGMSAVWQGGKGTPGYAAAEQWDTSKKQTRRTDIYALGCVLSEMALGEPVFVAESFYTLEKLAREADAHVAEVGLEGRLDGVAQGLGSLVAACLRVDAKARPESAAAVAEGLRGLEVGQGPAAAPAKRKTVLDLSGAVAGEGAGLAGPREAPQEPTGVGKDDPPVASRSEPAPSGPSGPATAAGKGKPRTKLDLSEASSEAVKPGAPAGVRTRLDLGQGDDSPEDGAAAPPSEASPRLSEQPRVPSSDVGATAPAEDAEEDLDWRGGGGSSMRVAGWAVAAVAGLGLAAALGAVCIGAVSSPSGGSSSERVAASAGETDAPLEGRTWQSPTTDMTLLRIPGGTFTMGCTPGQQGECFPDEKPAHQVAVSTFYLGRTEVTQGEWRAVMGSNPSNFSSCGDACPVEEVRWTDAIAFANTLSEREGLTPCYEGSRWKRECDGYRLPTEAEWERAARGGKDTLYAGGDSLGSVAWTDANSGGRTHPVGQRSSNAYGLVDMSGNVWEWCYDRWDGGSGYPGTDKRWNPVGSSGSNRVYRGGSWSGLPRHARVAYRGRYTPSDRNGDLGFRLARSAP